MLRHNRAGMVGRAREALLAMLSGGVAAEVLAALAAIRALPEPTLLQPVRALTQAADRRIRSAAVVRFGTLCRHAGEDCRAALEQALNDPEPVVRTAAIEAATALPAAADRLGLLARALQDRDLAVRQAAFAHAAGCMPLTEEEYRLALATYFDHFGMQSLLCRCLTHSDLAARRELLTESGRQHMARAYDKKTVAALLQRLPPQPSADPHGAPLLALVLAEDIQRHVGLVLEILESLDEGQSVRAVRAALASRDRRLRAQAVESVRHSNNDALLRLLLPLLEAEYDGAAWRHPLQHALATLEDVRAWCVCEGSAWLRECAAGSRQPESTQDLASPV
jgi:hypothetical protein